MQIIATQSKAKPKIFAKSDYQALWPVDAKYATRPSPLSVEHSQIVALFWNLRFCAPPPIKSGQGPKSPSVVKVAPPPLVVSAVVSANCINALNVFLLNIWRRPNVHQTFYQIPLQNIRHLIKIKQNYPAPMVFLRNKYTNPKIHPISDTRCVCICLRWLKQRTHHVILDSRKV